MIEAVTDEIDPWLLAKLVCPVTRGPLRWDADQGFLISEAAGLAYPVRDGVPVLLAREAIAVPTDASAACAEERIPPI